MNQEKIGRFIAELRKEKNLTQEELANKLGITKNAVSKWERGLCLMDASLFKPVCKILGISIVELLNGEKISQEEIKSKTDDTIKNTIDYSNNKIKKNRIKNIIYTILIIVIFCIGLFFGYKLMLLNKYTFKKPDNVDEILKGLKNQKEIKIYKRTIPEKDYLELNYFKIRNDFEDYKRVENEPNSPIKYYIYEKNEDGKKYSINFGMENGDIDHLQYIDLFATKEATFYGADYSISSDKFNSADKKYFLLKNDINNDIDFYKYIAKHYYQENNIFMSKREMMENYSFNTFVSVAIPRVDEFTIIKGDYQGYILKLLKDDEQTTQVTLIRDGKIYGFLTNDSRFKDDKYLIDLVGTIEIK